MFGTWNAFSKQSFTKSNKTVQRWVSSFGWNRLCGFSKPKLSNELTNCHETCTFIALCIRHKQLQRWLFGQKSIEIEDLSQEKLLSCRLKGKGKDFHFLGNVHVCMKHSFALKETSVFEHWPDPPWLPLKERTNHVVLQIFPAFLELLPEDEAKIFQDGGKTEETKVFVREGSIKTRTAK